MTDEFGQRRVFNALPPDEEEAFSEAFMRIAASLHAADLTLRLIDPPAPGSPFAAAREQRATDPYDNAYELLLSAEDHLDTVLAVLESRRLPIYSLYTLLRGAAEALVRTHYLLDPDVDPKTPLARALTWRLQNLEEQLRVKPDATEHFKSRVARLIEIAEETGIEVVTRGNGRGNPLAFGESRPRLIDLCRSAVVEGDLLYRFLSSHAHSFPWSKRDHRAVTDIGDPHYKLQLHELNVPLFANVAFLVLVLHEAAIQSAVELSGYPRAVWVEAKRSGVAEASTRLEKLGSSS